AHHRLGAADVEPELLRALGQRAERARHPAHRRTERGGWLRRRRDRARAQHRLTHRQTLLDARGGQPELEAVPAEVGLPHRLLEEGLGGGARAPEPPGDRMRELTAEQAPHQRNHEGLGEGAFVPEATVERQHQAIVLLEHRRGEPAQPLTGHARQIGVEHDDGAGLEHQAHREDRAHRGRQAQRAVQSSVSSLPGLGPTETTRRSPSAAVTAAVVASDRAWSTWAMATDWPGKCASRPERTAAVTAARAGAGPAVARPTTRSAVPIRSTVARPSSDSTAGFIYRVRWASKAR